MKRIAFLDLDLTLFDYTLVREGATRAALNTLNLNYSIDETLRVMNHWLIPYGDSLADVGLPNFRREWKAPELFALLLLMNVGKGLSVNSNALADLVSVLTNISLADQSGKFHQRRKNFELLSNALESSLLKDVFFEASELIKRPPHYSNLKEAVNAFDEYLANNARPFHGVGELLINLNSRGFEVYTVSEGKELIQREKLSVLGLHECTNGTYVSSSCCESERLLSWLWKSAKEIRTSDKTRWLEALELIYDEVLLYSTKTSSLFRKILHTVLYPNSSREKFYRQFGWLGVMECLNEEPVCILLFGDRYDKDLQPGIDAFQNVISIRLLRGKYENTYESDVIENLKLPQPTATVHSVAEAAQIVKNLPLDQFLSGQIIAPNVGSHRKNRIQKAIQTVIGEDPPRSVTIQLEELERALAGSEMKPS